MKNKRLVLYFFALTLTLILILPMVNLLSFISQDGLSKIKEIKKETILNTDKLETLVSFIVYKLFNKSIFPQMVVTGKDNFLFLGNRYAEVLNKTNGKFQTTDKEVEQFLKKLLQLQQWYEAQGIKFVIAIAPNKHTIYKEKLPNWISYDGTTITDKIVEKNKRYGIHLVDLRQSLLDAKQDETRLLYQKTDTHWNMLGASIGYEEVIDYMNKEYLLNIKKITYDIVHSEKKNHRGGLFRFLKADDFFDIRDYNTYEYKFDKLLKVCHGKINIKNGKIKKCKIKSNPIMATNHQPQYIINDNEKLKMLYLGDSFSTYSSQLFNVSFYSIWKLHFRKFKGKKLIKFIKKHKPDIVFYQVVERDFYKNTIFNVLQKNAKRK